MRLGGMIPSGWKDAEEWALSARKMGYRAVVFPLDYTSSITLIDSYVKAAQEHDLVIAEVGVWNNVLAKDVTEREEAYTKAVRSLELAEYVGARCCVNIAGSYSQQWDGPHEDHFTEKCYDEIVSVTQKIIDAVNPKCTVYSLEPMPWMYPNNADSYLSLIESIDREGFGVHLDPVNTINSLELYYENGKHIEDWFNKLSNQIVSCHAKDIILRPQLTLHLDECEPGLGNLDYSTYLKCLDDLEDPDICLLFEHMTDIESYKRSVDFVKNLCDSLNIDLIT